MNIKIAVLFPALGLIALATIPTVSAARTVCTVEYSRGGTCSASPDGFCVVPDTSDSYDNDITFFFDESCDVVRTAGDEDLTYDHCTPGSTCTFYWHGGGNSDPNKIWAYFKNASR